MKKIISLILLSGFSVIPAFGRSSVWVAKKGDSVTYLGGTCHLLRPSDFPLPVEFDAAYNKSDTLVFETDIDELSSAASRKKLMAAMMYTDGSTLADHLLPKTLKLLKERCDAEGMPLEMFKQFKPAMITVSLTSKELMDLGVGTQGVDAFLSARANTDQKPVRALESVDQQIKFICDMGKGNADALITQTLKELTKTKQEFMKMLEAWKKGDENALYELMVPIKAQNPEIYKELLLDRNAAWLPVIDRYSNTPETEFVLVGVAHLVGPDGLLESLKKRGYSITQL